MKKSPFNAGWLPDAQVAAGRFYPETREWRVTPAFFNYMRLQCDLDPSWPLGWVRVFGMGEVRVVVDYTLKFPANIPAL